LVVATIAAVKTRSRWLDLGCAALLAVIGAEIIFVYLVLYAVGPCLD